MPPKLLTLKDMIDGSGCTPRTVRYYEREGLLRAARSPGGHRLFAACELERLNFIVSLREAGWALEEVTDFLSVRERAGADVDAAAELEAAVRGQIDRLERRLEVLQRLRDDLTQTAGLLPVCIDCTSELGDASCATCSKLPALGDLPRSFRLAWRARELAGRPGYDERGADCLDDEEL